MIFGHKFSCLKICNQCLVLNVHNNITTCTVYRIAQSNKNIFCILYFIHSGGDTVREPGRKGAGEERAGGGSLQGAGSRRPY